MSAASTKRVRRGLLVAPVALALMAASGTTAVAATPGSGIGGWWDSKRSTGEMGQVSGMKAGDQRVSGLASRKKELQREGITSREMAIAMMETDDLSADYKARDGKSGDSANYGIFKQNWGMIRRANPDLAAMGQEAAGRKLNSDPGADLKALRNSREKYGDDWYAGHRNGAEGLKNSDTSDIRGYNNAVDWTTKQLVKRPSHAEGSDIRYWVEVPGI